MNNKLEYYYNRYLSNEATDDEFSEFMALLNDPSNEEQAKKLLGKTWDEMFPAVQQTPIRKMYSWKKIAIAASILLVIGLGSYLVFFQHPESSIQHPVAKTDVPAPSTNRAQITLADGTVVYLDSAHDGTLVQQGNVKLVKLSNGQIAYQTSSGEVIKEVKYNTLSNPRGSKVIDMQLADGSHVWLNAGSSITYPLAFVSNERKVSISGEAYFEVTHNSAMPFKVSKGDMEVTVLGTHFNVNAYDDKADIKVTLLEGSVRVSNSTPQQLNNSTLLKPGEQAVLTPNSRLQTLSPDLEEVMAWKNGFFQFINSDIKDIMKQIARWYDVEVVYESTPTKLFKGGMPRTMSAANVFKVLEETGGVHFKIEGRKVTVLK